MVRMRLAVVGLAAVLVGAVAGPVTGSPIAPAAAVATPSPVSSPGVGEATGILDRAAGRRPNIVVVMTDDQALTDMKAMPLTRRLIGRAGVTFRDGIAPNPLCCPARASLLTGQASHNNNVWTNVGRHGGYSALPPGSRLPRWLQNAGYRTGFFGKHLNGYDPRVHGRDPGWTILDSTVDGIYNYVGFSTYNNGRITQHPRAYITSQVSHASRAAVRRFEARDGAPFFLWINHVAPHRATQPWDCSGGFLSCHANPVPAPGDRRKFSHARPPSLDKPSFNERRVNDKAYPFSQLGTVDRGEVVREHRARLRSLASVDRAVAALVRTLRKSGELDDTVLIFTSDNGFMLGEHRWIGKTLGYEESLRVPLLVRGPGVARGQVARQTVTTYDLTATIVELARARPSHRLDGVSITPYLRDPRGAVELRDAVLVQSGGDGFAFDTRNWIYRGYRDRRYTLLRFHSGFLELYDRKVDPYQNVNRADDPAYAEIRQILVGRLRELRGCAGSACVVRYADLPEPG